MIAARQLADVSAVPAPVVPVAPDSGAGHGVVPGWLPAPLLPNPDGSGAAAAIQLPSVPAVSAPGSPGVKPPMRSRTGGHADSRSAPAAAAARQLPTSVSANVVSVSAAAVSAPASRTQRHPSSATAPTPEPSRGPAPRTSDQVSRAGAAAPPPDCDSKRAKLLALVGDAMALQAELNPRAAQSGVQRAPASADSTLLPASIPAAGARVSQTNAFKSCLPQALGFRV